MAPTLSVVLLNYNHGRYLPDSLGAVLAQSRQPDQLIVIDDASTDDSVRVIESLLPRAPYVTFLRNETNRGVLATCARGLEVATGDYLYLAAADDRILPGFFERLMGVLAEYPQAGLCSSYFAALDDVTGEVTEHPSGWCTAPRYFSPTEVAGVVGACCIASNASIIKRSAFLEAGGYPPELRWHCDWFNNFVVAFRHGVCHVPETLALKRVLPQSYAQAGRRDAISSAGVYGEMARLLKSDTYRDVLPLFRESGVLLDFGTALVPFLREQGVSWERIIAHLPSRHLGALVGHADPDAVEAVARRLSADLREVSTADLEELLGHTDLRLRRRASFWARTRGADAPALVPRLLAMCADPDKDVRLAAANSADSLAHGSIRFGRRGLALGLCARLLERASGLPDPPANRRLGDGLRRRLADFVVRALRRLITKTLAGNGTPSR